MTMQVEISGCGYWSPEGYRKQKEEARNLRPGHVVPLSLDTDSMHGKDDSVSVQPPNAAEQETHNMTLQPEHILTGKYRLLRVIGEGAMGRVWLAEELTSGGQKVALKEIKLNLLSDAEKEVQNRNEQLTVESAPRNDLRSWVQHPNRLPIDQAVDTCELVRILERLHAHEVEIIHRDIKPSDVVFDEQGMAHLGGTGLAQFAGMNGGLRVLDWPYTDTPPVTDLYALGCVLYKVLAGQCYKESRSGNWATALQKEVPSSGENAPLTKQGRLMIVGAPGSGKTTILRYLALALEDELRSQDLRGCDLLDETVFMSYQGEQAVAEFPGPLMLLGLDKCLHERDANEVEGGYWKAVCPCGQIPLPAAVILNIEQEKQLAVGLLALAVIVLMYCFWDKRMLQPVCYLTPPLKRHSRKTEWQRAVYALRQALLHWESWHTGYAPTTVAQADRRESGADKTQLAAGVIGRHGYGYACLQKLGLSVTRPESMKAETAERGLAINLPTRPDEQLGQVGCVQKWWSRGDARLTAAARAREAWIFLWTYDLPYLPNPDEVTGLKPKLPRARGSFVQDELVAAHDGVPKTLTWAPLHGQRRPTLITQAMQGMGEVGKTQLAVECAYRYGHYSRGPHWLNAAQPALLEAEVAKCGLAMALLDWERLSENYLHTTTDLNGSGNLLNRCDEPLRVVRSYCNAAQEKAFPDTRSVARKYVEIFCVRLVGSLATSRPVGEDWQGLQVGERWRALAHRAVLAAHRLDRFGKITIVSLERDSLLGRLHSWMGRIRPLGQITEKVHDRNEGKDHCRKAARISVQIPSPATVNQDNEQGARLAASLLVLAIIVIMHCFQAKGMMQAVSNPTLPLEEHDWKIEWRRDIYALGMTRLSSRWRRVRRL